MCSAAEDSDATVCGEEEEEEGVHSPSLMGTGTSAGLPGLCFLERAGSVQLLDTSRQDRDEGGSGEWEELMVVKGTLQSARQSLQALQLSLNTKQPQLQETMGGLKEVSHQLKQAQEGIKACAASANQERGKQVREVAKDLSACMKELAHLTGVVREKLCAGVPSSSSSSLVHDSSAGDELPLSQEIPLQGISQHHPSSQAPPPSMHAHKSKGGAAPLQPTPLVTCPPPPSEPAHPQRQTANGPTLPLLLAAQAPTTGTALPPVVPSSMTAHMLSATASLSDPACRQELLSSSVPRGAAPQPASTLPLTGSSSNRGGGVAGDQGGPPKPTATPNEEGSGSKSAEFAEAVPLQMLLREGLLCPGLSCLSTVIMGVKFVASLNADGSLSLPTGQAFPQPHLWVNACWEKIGHRNKRTKKGQAYKMVLYQGDPLVHYCQLYNRNKVRCYLQETSAVHKAHQGSQHPPLVPPLLPTQCTEQQVQGPSHPSTAGHGRLGDITALLAHCRVVPVREEEVCPPCYLPAGFWDVLDHVPDVEWFSGDLEWN